jgi:hypothetical protein
MQQLMQVPQNVKIYETNYPLIYSLRKNQRKYHTRDSRIQVKVILFFHSTSRNIYQLI